MTISRTQAIPMLLQPVIKVGQRLQHLPSGVVGVVDYVGVGDGHAHVAWPESVGVGWWLRPSWVRAFIARGEMKFVEVPS